MPLKNNVDFTSTSTAPQEILKESAASYDVYKKLRNDIISSRLKPSERLRFETLKKTYGGGVGTLREALSHLVSDGLVRTEVGRGFSVAPISRADLIDITKWRIEFEVKAVSQSIEYGDDNWEAEIVTAFHLLSRTNVPKYDAPADVWVAYGEKHKRFHDSLVSACKSPWLTHFRGVLAAQARRYQAIAVKRSDPMVYRNSEDHRVIMEAVLARDQKKATKLIEEHIQRTTDVVLDQLPVVDKS